MIRSVKFWLVVVGFFFITVSAGLLGFTSLGSAEQGGMAKPSEKAEPRDPGQVTKAAAGTTQDSQGGEQQHVLAYVYWPLWHSGG